MNKPKLLITHDGQFHADELFSIALLQHVFGDIPYKRIRTVTRDEFRDPLVWVLDQGMECSEEKHNFDHHQSKALTATNLLILKYLRKVGMIEPGLAELLRRPFMAISDYDRWGGLSFNGFQVNELIKTFNNHPNGFELALELAKAWLSSLELLASKRTEGEIIFKNGQSIKGIIRVVSAFPVLWALMGTEKLLVAPESGGWRLHSSDTENYPIVSTGKEVFLHENRFLATYLTQPDAIEAAKLTARLESACPIL